MVRQEPNPPFGVPMTEPTTEFGNSHNRPPPRRTAPLLPRRGPGLGPTVGAFILAAAIIYGAYFWFVRRVVVGPGQVLVLLKKDGSLSLPTDQVIVPRAPL